MSHIVPSGIPLGLREGLNLAALHVNCTKEIKLGVKIEAESVPLSLLQVKALLLSRTIQVNGKLIRMSLD